MFSSLSVKYLGVLVSHIYSLILHVINQCIPHLHHLRTLHAIEIKWHLQRGPEVDQTLAVGSSQRKYSSNDLIIGQNTRAASD